MEAQLKILILEDSPDDVDLIERELTQAGISFTSAVVKTGDAFKHALQTFNPDVVLSDHLLPHFNSIEAFALYKEYQKDYKVLIPFILITGVVSEEFAVQCMKAGMHDYILKDRLKRLPLSIEGALEKCKIESERQEYLNQVIAKERLMNEAEHLARFGGWEVDLLTGKHTWSDETYRIYGYTPGEIVPDFDVLFRHVHPDEVGIFKARYSNAVANMNTSEGEFRIIDNQGKVKYLSCRLEIQRDQNEQPIRIVGFNLDITGQRKTANRLQKSEQEYKSLFDQNPDAVFSLNLEGRFTKVNASIAKLAGIPMDELLGMDFRDVVHRDDLEKVYHHYLSCLAGQPQRYEARFLNGMDEIITLDVTNMPIVIDGVIMGIHGVAKDVTETKQMEGLLNSVNRMAFIGGWEVDLVAQKVSWTSITKQLHEVEPDYEPDMESALLFCEAGTHREKARQALKDCMRNGTPWELELQLITAKGNERWVRSIGEAEMINGKCIRLYGSLENIHARKKAEETLKEEYREKVNILERIGDVFFAVDHEWTVTYWNNRAETQLGIPKKDIIGKNLFQVFGDDLPAIFSGQYHKAVNENRTVHFEAYYPACELWVEVSAYPSSSGLSVYLKDVTDQKRHMREIENQNQQLAEIGWIQSHEMRAPLARMMGLLNLLKGDEKDMDLPFLLENIARSGEELDGLIRKIVRKTEPSPEGAAHPSSNAL